MPDPTSASDRGYVVVWCDEDDRETLADQSVSDDVHRILGGVVRILLRGDNVEFTDQERSAAKQLIEPLMSVRKIVLYQWNWRVNWTLQLLPEHLQAIQDEANKKILDRAFGDAVSRIFAGVSHHDRLDVEKLDFEVFREPEDVPLDWHHLLRQAKQAGNQGRRPRSETARSTSVASPAVRPPAEDGLTFTNLGELAVYRALKEIQAGLPLHETIGIFPLPGARVLNQTFEPDILVTYRGRVGILEIDGPKHRGRYANDRSRDRLFMNAGIPIVERLGAEEVSDQDALDAFLRIFIDRLAK
ncbi:hypothetical protein [Nonomuraea sp. SBT364]|uniref:hypothetical protein n=1 Tax=Nonomuraea sp. SBT364 TaxID=1580530 RepID=UPI000A924608|nr:hypothetical protein [Nonomuraea sp. SBT364]